LRHVLGTREEAVNDDAKLLLGGALFASSSNNRRLFARSYINYIQSPEYTEALRRLEIERSWGDFPVVIALAATVDR
jgi:hypothetical protein